jgi:ADP-ribosylglycohydrolase
MERRKAMVYGSFIGDSLALGVHWIYNVKAIEKRVGRIDDLIAPVVQTFHPGKAAGQLTHYGDQMLLLLRFCAESCAGGGTGSSGESGGAVSRAGEAGRPEGVGGAAGSASAAGRTVPGAVFDRSAFLHRWVEFMESYDGYMDKASRATLANYRELTGAGKEPAGDDAASSSDDLAGAGRIAPVLYFTGDGGRLRGGGRNVGDGRSGRDDAVAAARAQASVTHNNPTVLESAAFFTDLVLGALEGVSPVERARELIETEYRDGAIAELVRKGLESAGADSTGAIAGFGQACSVEMGVPSVMHLISAYEGDLKEALVAGCMAGGDSAARNHAIGMILGAYLGVDDLPQKWFDSLEAREEIERLLQ